MTKFLNGIRKSRSLGRVMAANKTAVMTCGGVESEPASSHSSVIRSKSRSLFMLVALFEFCVRRLRLFEGGAERPGRVMEP